MFVSRKFIPSSIPRWIALLDSDKEGDPIYQAREMTESRYNPDIEEIARKTSLIGEVLISTRDALVCFIISLPAPDQIYKLVREAILPCVKILDTITAFFGSKSIGNAGDQDDEDKTNTIVNGGDNGDQEEVPQDEENNSLNQDGDNPVPSLPYSQRNSLISSKSLKIEGKSY